WTSSGSSRRRSRAIRDTSVLQSDGGLALADRRRSVSTGELMNGSTRVLEEDPDLGQGLDPDQFALAERELVVATLDVPGGRWDALRAGEGAHAELGLLILDGVLARDVRVGKRASLEILGPGDLLRAWPTDRHAAPLSPDLRFEALEPVRLAILDGMFA